MELDTVIGALAALCITASSVTHLGNGPAAGPSGVRWPGLSTVGAAILALGVVLWVAYGALSGDRVIVAANAASLLAIAGLLLLRRGARREAEISAADSIGRADGSDEALRHSEVRYRTVVESAKDYAIFTTDVEGRVVDWYAGAAAVFGWSAAEITGRPMDVMFVPSDRDRGEPQRELATAAQTGMAPDVRWHARKDGRRVFIEGKVVPLAGRAGRPQGFLKIGQDVTERRRAERALRQSEERFSRFADASSDVLWIRDAATLRFDYVSPAFEAIYGLPMQEATAGNNFRRWLKLVHPQDRKSALDGIRAVRAGLRATHEFRICRPDGELRWIRDTGFPLLDEAGKVTSVAGIGADSTDEKIASNRRQVLMNELQHRTRNLIAVVQALAVSTEREATSLPDFQARFRPRLVALARVQSMLSRLSDGERITFDTLLTAELAAHGLSEGQPRVTLHGPEGIALKSRNVQTFALALHELATNAVKHGAFASSEGQLTVRWWLDQDETQLHVDWKESGIDTTREAGAPAASGYGRELIERALPYQMDARTTYAIEPDGVHCTIVLALSGR